MQSATISIAKQSDRLEEKPIQPVRWASTILMLLSRSLLFFLWQAVFAGIFALLGRGGWNQSIAWWLLSISFANLCVYLLLRNFLLQEGSSLSSLYRIQRATWKKDLLALGGILLLAGPIGFFPNSLAATWLYGDAMTPMNMLLQPLPVWAAAVSIVSFPFIHALTELPTYFGFVMPRLQQLTGRWWIGWILASFFLGAQHIFAPLIFDGRFIIWRFLMFLPFAFFCGLVLTWRPRLLPYMIIVHVLMDLQLPIMVLIASLPK